ncbi:hypothetical protein U9M48_036676, partial [Paspalum notatum var. saurae]
SINGSIITLLPKVDFSNSVNDFRPIFLLNNSIKLLIKLLANRLQSVIQKLVRKNQYGSSKQEPFKISKKENLILKIDFEKAFDKIEHTTMLQIMEHKGFRDKWLKWMESIFSFGTSAVLLNGKPRKAIHYRRGGSPLPPYLVLAANFLQSPILNKAKEMGLLLLLIPLSHFRTFLYCNMQMIP